MKLDARVINKGRVVGEALVSHEPISFFGGVDPETGIITERGHELQGKSIGDKILVFPQGKGSTVGSYSLYRLMKNGVAPRAIINESCEPIVAVGAIISDIPCVDSLKIDSIKTGDRVKIDGSKVEIE
ncbi:MAG: DUF126 domain-containing protein [Candidatus Altiarchaeales archaeon]|nr:DUF126 domain-containing protein [Candidatus Altiarchaeales archaeon]